MAIDVNSVKPGDKVHYINPYNGKAENGIIKKRTINNTDYIFVVYHWNNTPEKFMYYTAELTPIGHLYPGWL